jgi:1-acyl-sn-glycerol-3-phosphate acyltransferase
VPRLLGFIAKRELKRLPVISFWMHAMHCVFLERRSARQALGAIERAARQMQAGRSMIIFPEGTRSRSRRMGRFKPGSMYLPKRAGAAVLPVTIDGAYRLFEEHGRITPARVRLTFHEVVPAATVQRLDRKELALALERTIASALDPGRGAASALDPGPDAG